MDAGYAIGEGVIREGALGDGAMALGEGALWEVAIGEGTIGEGGEYARADRVLVQRRRTDRGPLVRGLVLLPKETRRPSEDIGVPSEL